MTRYGYVCGRFEDQVLIQEDILEASGIDLDGGIVRNVPWSDFLFGLESGDVVVVVAKSRLSLESDARKAEQEVKEREDMLKMLGVELFSLS